jgi:adenylate kinase
MTIVLVAPPGARTDTHARNIARRYAVPHIATSDLFRAHVARGSALGRLASSYMAAGDLVPDRITTDMVRGRLGEPDAAHGFLLDGYPRNVAQAYGLDAILSDLRSCVDVVLEFAVGTEPTPQGRAARRRQVRRVSDDGEVIRHRVQVYDNETAAVRRFYRGRRQLIVIDLVGSAESVTKCAIDALLPFEREYVSQLPLDAAM